MKNSDLIVSRLKWSQLQERLAVLEARRQFEDAFLTRLAALIREGKSFTVTRVHDSWDIIVQD